MLALLFTARLVDALISQDPADATRLACQLERYSDCSEVLAILAVESKGHTVSVHTRHHPRVRGQVFWHRAVMRGLLHPERCAAHQSTDGGVGFGIRGPHGLAAAYSVFVLGECVGPEAVDVPLLSATAAIRRLVNLQRDYGFDREQRAQAWRVGVGAVLRGAV